MNIEPELKNYIDFYVEIFNNYPHIQLNDFSIIEKNYQELQALPDIKIQDYSKLILNSPKFLWNLNMIEKQLNHIEKAIKIEEKNEQDVIINSNQLDEVCDFLKKLIGDLVFFVAFHPYICNIIPDKHKSQFDYQHEMSYFSSNLLSIHMVVETIGQITKSLDSVYDPESQKILAVFDIAAPGQNIDFIKIQDYNENISYWEASKKLSYLSLLNFRKSFRKQLIEDKLFNAVLSNENCFKFLLGCSNTDEQYFLNSCNTGAYNLCLISHSCNISCLLLIMKGILDHFETVRIPRLSESKNAYSVLIPYTAPSIKTYSSIILAKAKATYEHLLKTSFELLASKSTTIEDIWKLTLEWNLAMQELSSIFFPNWPVILSKKPVRGNWHASAKLMFIICILTSVLPGQPVPWERGRGTKTRYMEVIGYINYKSSFTMNSHRRYIDFDVTLNNLSDEKALEEVTALWKDVFEQSGTLFLSKECVYGIWVGHLSFMDAIIVNEEKSFLVGDPEILRYKFTTLKQMVDLIRDPKICFNLFTGF